MFSFLYLISLLISLSISDEMIKTKWNVKLPYTNKEHFTRLQNYLYDETPIVISGTCSSASSKNFEINVHWIFLQLNCAEDIYKPISNHTLGLISKIDSENGFFNSKLSSNEIRINKNNFYLQYQHARFICNGEFIIKSDEPAILYEVQSNDDNSYKVYHHLQNNEVNRSSDNLVWTWAPGFYSVLIKFSSNKTYSASVNIEMPLKHGYLTVAEYPLLPFSGVMSICYLLISTFWIVLWARAQEHTRKVHVFIGISCVAGGFAFTFTFASLSMANTDGLDAISIRLLGASVAEIQMVLTIILLMAISTGYAINRPNLTRLSIIFIILITVSYLLSDLILIIINLLIYMNASLLHTVCKYVYVWKACSMSIILCWIGLCSLSTLSQLYSRGHSGKSKIKEFIVLVVFSIFAFLTHFVYNVYLAITLFNEDCHKSFHVQWALPCAHQLYLFVLLVTLMWLWRPMDDKKTYAFQPIKNLEEESELMDDVQDEDFKMDEI